MVKEKIQTITEGTVLPISLVITLVGGVLWLSQVNAKAEHAAAVGDQALSMFQSVNERLAHIEGYLERQEKKKDE